MVPAGFLPGPEDWALAVPRAISYARNEPKGAALGELNLLKEEKRPARDLDQVETPERASYTISDDRTASSNHTQNLYAALDPKKLDSVQQPETVKEKERRRPRAHSYVSSSGDSAEEYLGRPDPSRAQLLPFDDMPSPSFPNSKSATVRQARVPQPIPSAYNSWPYPVAGAVSGSPYRPRPPPSTLLAARPVHGHGQIIDPESNQLYSMIPEASARPGASHLSISKQSQRQGASINQDKPSVIVGNSSNDPIQKFSSYATADPSSIDMTGLVSQEAAGGTDQPLSKATLFRKGSDSGVARNVNASQAGSKDILFYDSQAVSSINTDRHPAESRCLLDGRPGLEDQQRENCGQQTKSNLEGPRPSDQPSRIVNDENDGHSAFQQPDMVSMEWTHEAPNDYYQLEKSFLALSLRPGDSFRLSRSPPLVRNYASSQEHSVAGLNEEENASSASLATDVKVDAYQLQHCVRSLREGYKELWHIRASGQYPERFVRSKPKLRWIYLYGIETDTVQYFFDRPQWVEGESGQSYLNSTIPLRNLDLYLERNKDISFVVFVHFVAELPPSSQPEAMSSLTEEKPVIPSHTSIYPVAEPLRAGLECLLDSRTSFEKFKEEYHATGRIDAPYLCCFHSRMSFDPKAEGLHPYAVDHLNLLWSYIDQDYGKEYKIVDKLLSRGMIRLEYIKYLFLQGEIVLKKTGRHLKAFKTIDWPEFEKGAPAGDLSTIAAQIAGHNGLGNSKARRDFIKMEVDAYHWEFDGQFKRKEVSLKAQIEVDKTAEIAVRDLEIYPLGFADEGIVTHIRRRGQRLWDCRHGMFVSYTGQVTDVSGQGSGVERYIVDLGTHKKLHGSLLDQQDDLGHVAFANPDPPSDDFLLLLPPQVKGFNIRDKKWRDLDVDLIEDVQWNEKAFESLVLPERTKKIIRALVTNQLAADKGTDLVQGKGQGLIILLHGGPGTGKTLTAESIAEIAKKPLYRVTCGDIGTDPEKVEKYMESVFHLGKIWNCVVLLDEADVFLQERNLQDLQRNALVSVFLRVLEYHEGILFLTSNRIGTFDEAFKSRIQLSLHYKPLGLPERKKVWRNFIKHLESMQEDSVDYADLRDHIDELAEKPLNGRQIRNAITLARQLAQYDNERLNHEHLEDVIQTQANFDDYVKTLNEDMTDDEKARELQIR